MKHTNRILCAVAALALAAALGCNFALADSSVPAAAGDAVTASAPAPAPAWGLVNLILAILSVAFAVALSLGLLSGGSNRGHGVLHTLTLALASLSAVAFLLTENVSRAMALTDRWTVVMAALALAQALLALFLAIRNGRRATETDA